MEPVSKEINGRQYRFTPQAASKRSLEMFWDVQSMLLPVVGGIADSAVGPMMGSEKLIAEFKAAGSGQGGLKAVVPEVLKAAADGATFSKIGQALGVLMGNHSFRAIVMELFRGGLAVEVRSANPVTGVESVQLQDIGAVAETHFAAHMGDFIQATFWVLYANYERAFSEAFGLRLTALGVPEAVGQK